MKRQPTREELKANHGTPEEFAIACWKAEADLMITPQEARKAIQDYRQEWKEAAEIQRP